MVGSVLRFGLPTLAEQFNVFPVADNILLAPPIESSDATGRSPAIIARPGTVNLNIVLHAAATTYSAVREGRWVAFGTKGVFTANVGGL